MKCFKCGSENPAGNVFCTICGTRLTVPAELCPQCRSPLQANARFCHICGKSLSDKNAVNGISDSKSVLRPKTKKLRYVWIGILAVLVAVVITTFIAGMLSGQWGNGDQDSKSSHEDRTETTDEDRTETTDEDRKETTDKERTKNTDEASSEMTNTYKETDEFVMTDENLIGLWSTEGPSGELVDPDTGYATGNIYNGTWYLFRSDGTYRYVIVGSGNIISGSVVCEGNYSVSDGKIYLTDVKESWYPDPAMSGQEESYKDKKSDDKILYYRFVDGIDTLIIDELDYFDRVAGYE